MQKQFLFNIASKVLSKTTTIWDGTLFEAVKIYFKCDKIAIKKNDIKIKS